MSSAAVPTTAPVTVEEPSAEAATDPYADQAATGAASLAAAQAESERLAAEANLAAAQEAKAAAAAEVKRQAKEKAAYEAQRLEAARAEWDRYNSAYQAEFRRLKSAMSASAASRGMNQPSDGQVYAKMAANGWPGPGTRP